MPCGYGIWSKFNKRLGMPRLFVGSGAVLLPSDAICFADGCISAHYSKGSLSGAPLRRVATAPPSCAWTPAVANVGFALEVGQIAGRYFRDSTRRVASQREAPLRAGCLESARLALAAVWGSHFLERACTGNLGRKMALGWRWHEGSGSRVCADLGAAYLA